MVSSLSLCRVFGVEVVLALQEMGVCSYVLEWCAGVGRGKVSVFDGVGDVGRGGA